MCTDNAETFSVFISGVNVGTHVPDCGASHLVRVSTVINAKTAYLRN